MMFPEMDLPTKQIPKHNERCEANQEAEGQSMISPSSRTSLSITAHKSNRLVLQLLDIRIGPGAAILPHEVKRIHLDFAFRMGGGHVGPRKFWRHCLPRLKYHNPAISMTVNRTTNQAGSATLTVFFAPSANTVSPTASPASTSTTDSSESFDRVEYIDVKNAHSSEILKKFLDVTKARQIEASAEEKAELREVKEFNERSQADREAQDRLNKVRAQEKAIMEQARRAVS